MPEQSRVDEVWDALEAEFGPVRTKSERGRRNSAVKELKEAGATIEEIKVAADFCRRNFTYYTERALCLWLSKALEEQRQSGAARDTFLRLVTKNSKQ